MRLCRFLPSRFRSPRPDALRCCSIRGVCYHSLLKTKGKRPSRICERCCNTKDEIPIRFRPDSGMMIAIIQPLKNRIPLMKSRGLMDGRHRRLASWAWPMNRRNNVSKRSSTSWSKTDRQDREHSSNSSNNQQTTTTTTAHNKTRSRVAGKSGGQSQADGRQAGSAGANGRGGCRAKNMQTKMDWGNLPPANVRNRCNRSAVSPTHYREATSVFPQNCGLNRK